LKSMSFFATADILKKEIRLLSDFLINQYLVPWDAQLTSLAKELTRIFYLENGGVLAKGEGIVTGSEIKETNDQLYETEEKLEKY